MTLSEFQNYKHQDRQMNHNDDEPEWPITKYESTYDHESTVYYSVFDEIDADRQPWILAFDRRQARQKRSSIRSIPGYVLIYRFLLFMVWIPQIYGVVRPAQRNAEESGRAQ